MKKISTPNSLNAPGALHLVHMSCNYDDKHKPRNIEVCIGFYVKNQFVKVYVPKADCYLKPLSF